MSGSITAYTGDSTAGDSGGISLTTGKREQVVASPWMWVGEGNTGNGGDLVGTAGLTTASSSLGGDVILGAGEATAEASTDGRVLMITAGLGSNGDSVDGGNGGDVVVTAGAGMGGNSATDSGGDVTVAAGEAEAGYGGSVNIHTGYSTATTSGDMTLGTADVGFYGVRL